jgi:hypothetical protein
MQACLSLQEVQSKRPTGLPCPLDCRQTRVMVDGVFVNCGDGLAKFEALLGTLSAGGRTRLDGRWHGPGPVGVSKSHVLLVHGLGGSGKSRLLQHFRELADGSRPDFSIASGRVRTVWLDWEDERQEQLVSRF